MYRVSNGSSYLIGRESKLARPALQPEPFEAGPQLDLAWARYISKTMLQILLSPPANAVSFVRG